MTTIVTARSDGSRLRGCIAAWAFPRLHGTRCRPVVPVRRGARACACEGNLSAAADIRKAGREWMEIDAGGWQARTVEGAPPLHTAGHGRMSPGC
jgi:hypothetical protein